MNRVVFRSQKAYRIYAILGLVVFVVVLHLELMRRQKMHLAGDVVNQKHINDSLNEELDKAHKQIQTLENFLSQTNVRQTLEDNQEKAKTILALKASVQAKEDALKQMNMQLGEVLQGQKAQEIDWQNKLIRTERQKDAEIENLQLQIHQLKSNIAEYQKRPLFDLSQRYLKDDFDFSDVVIRLRFLKYLCDYYPFGSMSGKKESYKQVIVDLKEILPNDSYVKNLKLLKVYTAAPLMAVLKDKYGSKNQNLDHFVKESNLRLSLQLEALIQYLKTTYGQNS